MCGLAGFTNVHPSKQAALITALAHAIDSRGGHAAGYVSTASNRGPAHARKLGKFSAAGEGFMARIAGDAVLIHARYATCGNRTINESHPYAIKRDGRTVLWGAHNGIVDGTRESAKEHGRAWETDSREVFELLADAKFDAIAKLQGYGTLAWIDNSARDSVRVVAMNETADLEVCYTDCGACVFGSTRAIIEAGMKAAGMTHNADGSGFIAPEVGQVYEIAANGKAYPMTDHAKVTVASWTTNKASRWQNYGWDDAADDRDYLAGYYSRGSYATRKSPAMRLMGHRERDPFHVSDTMPGFRKHDGIWQRDTDGKPMGDDTIPDLDELSASDSEVCPMCSEDTSTTILDGMAYMCDYCGHIWGAEDSADDMAKEDLDPVALAERVIDNLPEDAEQWTDSEFEAWDNASEIIRASMARKTG